MSISHRSSSLFCTLFRLDSFWKGSFCLFSLWKMILIFCMGCSSRRCLIFCFEARNSHNLSYPVLTYSCSRMFLSCLYGIFITIFDVLNDLSMMLFLPLLSLYILSIVSLDDLFGSLPSPIIDLHLFHQHRKRLP